MVKEELEERALREFSFLKLVSILQKKLPEVRSLPVHIAEIRWSNVVDIYSLRNMALPPEMVVLTSPRFLRDLAYDERFCSFIAADYTKFDKELPYIRAAVADYFAEENHFW